MELQRTKTSLDNERYERNMLEVELKDAEDKIKSLRKFVCSWMQLKILKPHNFFTYSQGAEIS